MKREESIETLRSSGEVEDDKRTAHRTKKTGCAEPKAREPNSSSFCCASTLLTIAAVLEGARSPNKGWPSSTCPGRPRRQAQQREWRPNPKPRALELVESGTYGSTPDAPATPHAMNTSPCATLAVRATLAVIVLANVVLVASLLAIGGRYPALVSPGLLALGFGLRHGFGSMAWKTRRRWRWSDWSTTRHARSPHRHRQRGKEAGLLRKTGRARGPLVFAGPQHDGRAALRHRRHGLVPHPVARRRRRASTGAVVSAVFSSVTLTLIGAFNLATVGPPVPRLAARREQGAARAPPQPQRRVD